MAQLNTTEKLIRKAAAGGDHLGEKVFKALVDFYVNLDFLMNDNMHHELIYYLYCGNHKRKTFDTIARDFNRSVSTLEENRRSYQKMFLFFYDKLKAEES